ncbi:hypothetical protein ACFL9T_19735 [Thermodesulfobacteriota bacterium]
MEVRFEEDLGISPKEFTSLKGMLSPLFPDISSITDNFLIRLTPGELRKAYIAQASTCHPSTRAGLREKEKKSSQVRYEGLSTAYKTLRPNQ